MINSIGYLKTENDKLSLVNTELKELLREANEIIDAIKKGEIDSIFIANNEVAKTMVLKVANHTYRTFIDNMLEGVVTLHADGTIVYCNASFAKMVNLPLEKIVGTNFRRFIPLESVDDFESFFKENPDDNSKVALSILDIDGASAHFIISFNKLHLHDFEALNLVMTDITFQKAAEEKLKIANETLRIAIDKRMLSEGNVLSLNKELKHNIKTLEDANAELATFAYIASHDLQEPLRKISTFTSLFVRDYYHYVDDMGKQYISTIQSSSERMRKLINDILEYSSLSRNGLFKQVALASIFQEVLSELDIVINQTKATILMDSPLPDIEANPKQIKQLFQNICANSLKFIKPGVLPVIRIDHRIVKGSEIEKMEESRYKERFCILYFKDNGIGFNPIYVNKIFTIFQRLNNYALYKGTGIGLSICKKIVERHNGFINAKSNPGEGAIFTVMLPVSQSNDLEHKK